MKLKIFNPALLAVVALLTISTSTFAQASPVAPPAPPAPPADVELTPLQEEPDFKFNDKDFQLKMSDLKVKMKDMHVKLQSLQKMKYDTHVKLAMKNMDKNMKQFEKKFDFKFDSLQTFKYEVMDSFKNIANNINLNITPQIAYGFKDFDSNFTYNPDDKNEQNSDVVEKSKNYSKTYSVDGNDVINIDNKFGKITVTTWNRSEVKVDVQIKVGANDDDKAQKLLDNVVIRDSKDGNGVSFRTSIDSDDDNGSWGNIFKGRNNVRKMEVNYTVYMPAKNPLTINNKYGSTDLPDLSGKLTINNSYGSLVAKALTNGNNTIRVKYGSASIGSLNGSDLDVAYGSLTLGDCDKLNADISYGSAKIARITTSGNINVKFSGSLNIGDLDKNVKNLQVNSSYSSVKVGINDAQNADFDITVHYGSFNYGSHDVNITSKTPADGEKGFNPTKTYKGHLGKGGADKTITINSNFGSVNFE